MLSLLVLRLRRGPGEAAESLGISQATLVTQINRLEHDIGGPLLNRAERGRPMTLTPLGEQVLVAIQQTRSPDTQDGKTASRRN